MKKIIIATVSFILVSTICFFSWRDYQHKLAGPDTLKLALDNLVENLDPAIAYSDDALVLSAQVLEPLYQYHYLKRPFEIEPLLASGLPSISSDGKTYRIKMRQNVFYHPHSCLRPGRMVELKDIITQFKRVAFNPLKSPGKSLFANVIKGYQDFSNRVGGSLSKLKSESISGLYTEGDELVIELINPEPNLIYYLSLNFIVPVPEELVDCLKNKLSDVLVGTGPYQYAGFKENKYYDLIKNPDYRLEFYPSVGDRFANVQNLLDSSKQRIPFLPEVHFYVLPGEKERWDQFIDEELDIVTVPKSYIPLLFNEKGELSKELADKNFQIQHFPILANRWLGFNMKHPLVGKNPYLRKAIAYGINYQEYLRIMSQNTNLRSNSLLVPGIWGYHPTQKLRYDYRPDLAHEYLKMGGFEKNTDRPKLIYSTRGNQEIHLIEANFIKDQLAKIGLEVEIEILTFSEFLSKGRAGELMFFTDNWLFDYPDGENILQLLYSRHFPGVNKSAYSNSEVDALYLKLKDKPSLDEKDQLMQKIEDIVMEDLPWIPLMYESSFVLNRPGIKNYRKSTLIRNYVKYLKYED